MTLKDLREKYRNHAFSDMLADIELAVKLGADAERADILAGIRLLENEHAEMSRRLSGLISAFIQGRAKGAKLCSGGNVAAWPSWNTPLSQATLRDVFGAAVILLIINWFLK